MGARRPKFDASALPLGLQPRTVFVTGKGGVGKSTVAAALALAWRDAGARTLLVEIEGQHSAASLLSPRTIGYEPVPVGEHVAAMRITLMDALREYARLRLKVKLVADRLVSNPVIDQFTQAAPGFRELLVLGKLWAMSRETDDRGRPKWDAIIVDAPATGHGLGLLSMAGVIARMFPVGPISAEAKAIDAFTKDSEQVGVILVSLPEELPVTETLELRDQLAERGIDVAAAVLNGLLVDRFTPAEAEVVAERYGQSDVPAHVRHALETVGWEHVRTTDQAEERERLEQGLDTGVSVLPYMFAPQLEREHITSLSRWLVPAGQAVLLAQLAGAADGPAAAAAVHAAQAEES
ncbi:MAG: Anion-transporting ATPase [Thermoleophilia bacterium]|nr:Anion-transporting ATPase [Thermoleophilia bacterium]